MAEQWAEIMAKKHLKAARKLNGSLDPYVFEATLNRIARDSGYLNIGDMVISLAAMPINEKGMVNTLRVREIQGS